MSGTLRLQTTSYTTIVIINMTRPFMSDSIIEATITGVQARKSKFKITENVESYERNKIGRNEQILNNGKVAW